MLPAERHRRILDRLHREVSLSCATLLQEFSVTPMTLWRDLKTLESQGLLKRVRGGVMRIEVAGEPRFDAKLTRGRTIKARLAEHVARHYVRAGDVLALEGGTTVAAVASRLRHAGLTVLTNSLPILNELQAADSRPSIYASGGLLREESGTFVGREAVSFFRRRRATTFIMSATGFTLTGTTDPNPLEIEVKQAMAGAASRVVMVAEAQKFGIESLMMVLPWRRIHTLVTERSLPRECVLALRRMKVKVDFV